MTVWPTLISPISASFTADHTRMWLRSLASRNRLGAFMPATTVWPTFTRRSITMPSMGEVMVVYARLISACLAAIFA